ncbi:MAG: hypothetical protein LAT84_00565 [Balneolia bacterium]|nr:hypothetical protein [Balneolia bacterium]
MLLALLITPWVIKFAFKIGATDSPDERKVHKKVMPRIGGLAVFVSMALSIPLSIVLFPELLEELLLNLNKTALLAFSFTAIFALGFWDDMKNLSPEIKFGIQFAIAAVIYFAGFKISMITHPFGDGLLNVELIDFPLTLLWIVGVTNAFNLIDGLDGLASGVAAIACLSIFTVSALAGQVWPAVLALVLAGALIGFLRYNFNPAKIFLGDSGSLFIGFALALLSIQSTTKITTGFALLFPVLVLALPITDTIISMVRRFLGSYLERNPSKDESILKKIHFMFRPDRAHIHHQLISLGLTHRNAVLCLYGVSVLFAISAFSLSLLMSREGLAAVAILSGVLLFVGVKKLSYHEIAIFNNGLMMPLYERWIINRSVYLYLVDLFFIAAAGMLSYILISTINSGLDTFIQNEIILMLSLASQMVAFWVLGLYKDDIRQFGIGNALHIVSAVAYAVGLSGVVIYFAGFTNIPVLFVFLVMNFYVLLSFVLGFRVMYRALRFWFNREKRTGERVLIYGANDNGLMLLNKLNHSPEMQMKIIGFLDDDQKLEGKIINGYPILGNHWKLSKTLEKQKIDSILICKEEMKSEDLNRIKDIAHSKGVQVKWLHISMESIFKLPKPASGNMWPVSSDTAVSSN